MTAKGALGIGDFRYRIRLSPEGRLGRTSFMQNKPNSPRFGAEKADRTEKQTQTNPIFYAGPGRVGAWGGALALLAAGATHGHIRRQKWFFAPILALVGRLLCEIGFD